MVAVAGAVALRSRDPAAGTAEAGSRMISAGPGRH
jgi:hypothetical protein